MKGSRRVILLHAAVCPKHVRRLKTSACIRTWAAGWFQAWPNPPLVSPLTPAGALNCGARRVVGLSFSPAREEVPRGWSPGSGRAALFCRLKGFELMLFVLVLQPRLVVLGQGGGNRTVLTHDEINERRSFAARRENP